MVNARPVSDRVQTMSSMYPALPSQPPVILRLAQRNEYHRLLEKWFQLSIPLRQLCIRHVNTSPGYVLGRGLLHTAVSAQTALSQEFVSVLLDEGADCNARDHEGETPFHRAAMLLDCECLAKMIATGGSTTLADQRGRNVFHIICATQWRHVRNSRLRQECVEACAAGDAQFGQDAMCDGRHGADIARDISPARGFPKWFESMCLRRKLDWSRLKLAFARAALELTTDNDIICKVAARVGVPA